MTLSGPVLADGNARLAAARRLRQRAERRARRLFLAEGAPSVREALAAGAVVELFVTAADHPLAVAAEAAGVPVAVVSPRAAAALSDTTTPQGLVAVCAMAAVGLADVLAGSPRMVAVLVEPNEPGNVGAVVRTADAAGADAVVVVGHGVDVHNGKAVRASAGSLFHLDVVQEPDVAATLTALRAAGVTLLATTGGADTGLWDLDDVLRSPHAWLFGTEAHGLPPSVLDAADVLVRIPVRGRAESLNLAAAAAVCLYAGARAATDLP